MKKNIENKENGIMEVVFILDRSGSMSGLESDTIGGFNSTLKEQKQKKTVSDKRTVTRGNSLVDNIGNNKRHRQLKCRLRQFKQRA